MQSFGLARLGRDAEVRHTPGGEVVARLSLAFSWGAKGEDGNRQTLWVEGNMWGKRAEVLSQYLKKGTLVSVTLDDVHTQTYESNGEQRHKVVGRVGALDLAGGGQERSQAPAAKPAPAPAKASSGFDDMDDDIPF